jgi:hypothetical protein
MGHREQGLVERRIHLKRTDGDAREAALFGAQCFAGHDLVPKGRKQ